MALRFVSGLVIVFHTPARVAARFTATFLAGRGFRSLLRSSGNFLFGTLFAFATAAAAALATATSLVSTFNVLRPVPVVSGVNHRRRGRRLVDMAAWFALAIAVARVALLAQAVEAAARAATFAVVALTLPQQML